MEQSLGSAPSPPPATVPHATRRWVRAVLGILDCTFDPKTIDAWGSFIGASSSAIRQWCRSAGVRPKASLDFARVLRAVVVSQGRTWDLYNLLDVVDERTMRNLLFRGGLPGLMDSAEPPETQRYLADQRFVSRQPAVQAVAASLRETSSDA
jgi:hypothetical protein